MSDPSPKKAKTGEESYYKIIDGVKYDRSLLESVEAATVSGGQVGWFEAKGLWKEAEDGVKVTDIERATLEYAMQTYKFSEKAKNYLTVFLEAGTHKSYYKEIDGVKYDRALLEHAEMLAADGQLSWGDAKKLFEDGSDGQGLTGTEKDTFTYMLKTLKFTDKARQYTEAQLKLDKPTSYYKVIDGEKYDQALILEFEDAMIDGLVSEAEAKRIWVAAQDGKGVTDIEKATIGHMLKIGKFTDPAKKLLEENLGGA